MALKKSWESSAGLLAENAYYRITSIRFDIAAGVGGADFGVYQSQAARDSGKPPAAALSFNDVAGQAFTDLMVRARALIVGGMNVYDGIRTALYEHYKANRPEFSGATDV